MFRVESKQSLKGRRQEDRVEPGRVSVGFLAAGGDSSGHVTSPGFKHHGQLGRRPSQEIVFIIGDYTWTKAAVIK